jgi:hypothetical protein
MRSTDVDLIASAIVDSLGGDDPRLLGCASISSPIAYAATTDGGFDCSWGYQCGGAATFDCATSVEFTCGPGTAAPQTFFCPTGLGAAFTCTAPRFACASPSVFSA